MKLKKIMLMTAMAAAIGSVNMVSALADETATGETKFGWECDANNNWRYYNADGNLATGWIKAEEGDGRGNAVWYYIDPTSQIMVSNVTRNIGGVDYTFNEDGSWVDPSGKVFMSLDKQSDLREVLEAMGQEYGVTFTPEETKKFMLASTFGVPMKSMKKYLDLPQDQQDAVLKNEGIPTDSIDNQFKAWVRNARAVNSDLRIAIKADANTPYSVIKNVMNSLQDLRENRYNLITSLKTTSEE